MHKFHSTNTYEQIQYQEDRKKKKAWELKTLADVFLIIESETGIDSFSKNNFIYF